MTRGPLRRAQRARISLGHALARCCGALLRVAVAGFQNVIKVAPHALRASRAVAADVQSLYDGYSSVSLQYGLAFRIWYKHGQVIRTELDV